MKKAGVLVAMACLPLVLQAAEVDADAAKALLKKNNCFKCHALDKKKDGPSYKEVASKRKSEAGAEEKLYKHLTTSPKVKVDGKEEEHKEIKAKDDAEIHNVIRWILSL